MTGAPFVLERTTCARPTVRERRVVPCGQPATVLAPEGSGFTWAYCPRHAQQEADSLELEIRIDVVPGVLAAEKRQKLDALRIALEVS
jgi:hypothetical protein